MPLPYSHTVLKLGVTGKFILFGFSLTLSYLQLHDKSVNKTVNPRKVKACGKVRKTYLPK